LADAIREQDGLCAAIGQPAKENRPASDTQGLLDRLAEIETGQ
jgi:hypothetical protein